MIDQLIEILPPDTAINIRELNVIPDSVNKRTRKKVLKKLNNEVAKTNDFN